MFIITSCNTHIPGGTDRPRDPKYEKYFIGNEGVRTQFEGNSPPSRVYYYLGADRPENTFEIVVRLKNEGSAFSHGATFVSGFDPYMFHVEGVLLEGFSFKDCVFDLRANPVGGLMSMLNCPGLAAGNYYNSNNWQVGFDNILEHFGWNKTYFNNLGINFGQSGSEPFITFDLNNPGINMDIFKHGKMLISASAPIIGLLESNNGKPYMIEADSYEYPGGGLHYETVPVWIKNWPQGLDETDQTFLITNCYLYTTYADPIVCIDPDPFSMQEKVCRPGQVKMANTQGAPVAITAIYQENTQHKVFFTIDIKNAGPGRIFYYNHLNRCSPYYHGRTTRNDIDVVYVAFARIGDTMLDCVPQDRFVRLLDGVGTITCTYDLQYATAGSAYKTPLIMELWYGYEDTIRRNVHFKRVT